MKIYITFTGSARIGDMIEERVGLWIDEKFGECHWEWTEVEKDSGRRGLILEFEGSREAEIYVQGLLLGISTCLSLALHLEIES